MSHATTPHGSHLDVPLPAVVSSFSLGSEGPPSMRKKRVLTTTAAVGMAAVLAAVGWYFYSVGWPEQPSLRTDPTTKPLGKEATAPTAMDTISLSELEERHGIKITLLAVTAAGGIVDFRYKVVDAAKATTLLQDPANMPTLTVVDSGLTLNSTQMGRHHSHMRTKQGAVPFGFYPNVRRAVKPGTKVLVAFGKVRVEPIVAQ
jgi:hypothetical protein